MQTTHRPPRPRDHGDRQGPRARRRLPPCPGARRLPRWHHGRTQEARHRPRLSHALQRHELPRHCQTRNPAIARALHYGQSVHIRSLIPGFHGAMSKTVSETLWPPSRRSRPASCSAALRRCLGHRGAGLWRERDPDGDRVGQCRRRQRAGLRIELGERCALGKVAVDPVRSPSRGV